MSITKQITSLFSSPQEKVLQRQMSCGVDTVEVDYYQAFQAKQSIVKI